MDNLEINKILSAFLFACLVLAGTATFVDYFYSPPEPDSRGYSVLVEDDDSVDQSPQEDVLTIAQLLATGNPQKGAVVAKKCMSCHTYEKGGANRNGPNLWGIINDNKARVEGFSYSKAMSQMSGVWTYEELAHFIRNPRQYVKGTKMSFAGLKKDQELADIMAYMRTMHDSPPPLPSD